jgi:3-hydroxyisobutyrate dehydrogenase
MGKVGFLGIGTMGSRMCARLLAAGHELTVWNRTVEKTAPLCEKGATLAGTPAEAASGKDILLTNLTDYPALLSVISRPGGVLEADPLPPIFVDFATISPAESAKIAELLEAKCIAFLRAPVSGTANIVELGKLTIMTSGDKAVNDAADQYLAALGEIRYYMGTGEKSRYIKLIHQMLIAGVMQIWGEGLVMGEKAGLDWRLMMEVLSNSAVGSPALKGKIPTLAEHVYEPPAMSLHNIVKDLDLSLAAGDEAGVDLPLTARARELYQRAMDAGFEWKDYSAIVMEMEARAGLDPKETVR